MRDAPQPLTAYLDTSVYNRPFDDLTIPRNRLEAEATLMLLEAAEHEALTIVSSYVVVREVFRSPLLSRRAELLRLLRVAKRYVRASPAIAESARLLQSSYRLDALDALHVACAQASHAHHFVCVDDGLCGRLDRGSAPLRCTSPIELVRSLA